MCVVYVFYFANHYGLQSCVLGDANYLGSVDLELRSGAWIEELGLAFWSKDF